VRGNNNQRRWPKVRSKKRIHSSILTLDDLPTTDGKYSALIAQLLARYKAAKELRDDKPSQKSDDFSIRR